MIGGSGDAGIDGRNGSRNELRLVGDGETRLRDVVVRARSGDLSCDEARLRGGVEGEVVGEVEMRSGARSGRAGTLSDRD